MKFYKNLFIYKKAVILKDRLLMLKYFDGVKLDLKYKYDIIKLINYENTFFGYYDLSPFNPKDSSIVTLHANNYSSRNKPDGKSTSTIFVFDINSREFQEVGTTKAWNWQQGSRLSWIDKEHLLYNVYNDKSHNYEMKVVNIITKEIFKYPITFQAFKSNHEVLGIDYKILASLRPDYGYFCHNDNEPKCKDGGIWCHNMNTNQNTRIVSAAEIASELNLNINSDNYWINHVLVSPDKFKFIFLFRYISSGNTFHNLVLYDFKTESYKIILKNVISHYCWKDNESFIYWGRQPQPGYYLYNLNKSTNKTLFENIEDGHPSYINKNRFLTDTYPLKDRKRKLYYLNIESKKSELVGKFFEDPIFRYEIRCDLHPSISFDHKYIQIDSNFNNKRNFILLYNE